MTQPARSLNSFYGSSQMMTIRRASPADAQRLSGFARRLFHETFGPHNTPEDMEAYLSGALTPSRQLAETPARADRGNPDAGGK